MGDGTRVWVCGDVADLPYAIRQAGTAGRVAIDGDRFWLDADERAAAVVGRRFAVRDGWLWKLGSRAASMEVPDLDWKPIADAIECTLPTPAVARRPDPAATTTLRLVRGGLPSAIVAVALSLDDWAAWIDDVDPKRWRGWTWVVRGDKAIVRRESGGASLPPSDRHYYLPGDRLLIAAGFSIEPPVSDTAVREVFKIESDDDWLVWEPDGWGVVAETLWRPVTRGAVRAARAG